MHEDTCIEPFASMANSISSNKLQNKHIFRLARLSLPLLGLISSYL